MFLAVTAPVTTLPFTEPIFMLPFTVTKPSAVAVTFAAVKFCATSIVLAESNMTSPDTVRELSTCILLSEPFTVREVN